MKSLLVTLLLASALLGLSSCSRRGFEGGVIGGAVGAGAGALVGGGTGAAVGAGFGAVSGAAIGESTRR